jgi:hypothetical protein
VADHYRILGVKPDATLEEIQEAYRAKLPEAKLAVDKTSVCLPQLEHATRMNRLISLFAIGLVEPQGT